MFVHLPPPPARSLQQSNDWHRTEAGEGESVRRGALIELINRRRHRIYRGMDGPGRTDRWEGMQWGTKGYSLPFVPHRIQQKSRALPLFDGGQIQLQWESMSDEQNTHES